ncbi:MAG: putative Aminodeoxychorismate lyase [Rhodocyclaceae bacterium]|nr:putative Aminodeoxychorismate lyase [Rhodocyclaceae bacterium]
MRLVLKLFFMLLVGAAAVGGIGYRWATTPLSLRTSPVDFRILPGSSLRSAAIQVAEAGVHVPPALLVLLGRAAHAETGVKAGSYSVSSGVTPWQLLGKLTRGEVTQGEITLVEGWTLRQWRERLDAHPDLEHDSRGLPEAEILRRLGIDGKARAEGLFFPDTYLFDKHSSDIDLFARAYRAMQRKLDAAWVQRAANLPYRDPYQALIMASIVEKETGRVADRPLVAAVFVNRLRTGMLLQTDPTVIYGMGESFDGNIRKRDLLTDGPYNTYTRPGLPPTPIAMPGMASIQAALHPATSDALYFVARGDGSSHFSSSLDEHSRAVNRYQRAGR